MRRALSLVALVALLASAVVVGETQPAATHFDPIRLYVYTDTDPSGFTDPAQDGRQETVADIRKTYKKSKIIALVETAEQAEIVLKVLGRSEEPTGKVQRRGPYEMSTAAEKPILAKTLQAVLIVGTYELPMTASVDPSVFFSDYTWRGPAGRLAKDVEQWAQKNRAKLRTPPPGIK